MNRICLLFLLFIAVNAKAQNEDNVWVMGDFAGLDFNGAIPAPIQTAMNAQNKPSASVCDASGNLLFYTNGYQIFNRNNQIMPRGDSVIFFLQPPQSGNWNYLKRPAITPVPGASGKYYVFTTSLYNYPGVGTVGALLYSIVDMALDNGLGDVVPGQKRIILDTAGTSDGEDGYTGYATDIKNLTIAPGDNCSNVWLTTSSADRSYIRDTMVRYRAYEITPAGIGTIPVISSFQAPFYPGVAYGGYYSSISGNMIFSPDGASMVCSHNVYDNSWSGRSWIDLLHFDPATGIFSGLKRFGDPPAAQSPGGSCWYMNLCFSPDNSKLYAGTGIGSGSSPWYGLFQFNVNLLTAAAIDASRILIAPAGNWDTKLAPDGKIYITNAYGYQSLDRIEFPNLTGPAVQYTSNVVNLLPGTANMPTMYFSNYVVKAHVQALDTIYTSTNICRPAGDSILLRVDTGFNFVWNDGYTGNIRTVYNAGRYIAGHQFHCTWHVDTFKIIYFPDSLVTNGFSCPDQGLGLARIYPQAGDTTLFNYTWKDQAGNILRQQQSRHGDNISGLNPGRYALQINTSGNCDTSYEVEILPYPASQPAFTADSLFCKGDTVLFTNHSSGFEAWTWYFGDGSQSNYFNPGHAYTDQGDYTIMLVTTTEHCSDTARKEISVKGLNLELAVDPALANYGDGIQLTTTASENYSVLQWQPQWLFTQQQTLTQHITADSSSTYLVVGVSDFGCIDTAVAEVKLNPIALVPNAFSPNGDGLNDNFFPAHTGDILDVKNFQVFNRWGQLIWNGVGKSALKGWDGTYNGRPADAGAYYWYIELRTIFNKTDKRKGDVTLIR